MLDGLAKDLPAGRVLHAQAGTATGAAALQVAVEQPPGQHQQHSSHHAAETVEPYGKM